MQDKFKASDVLHKKWKCRQIKKGHVRDERDEWGESAKTSTFSSFYFFPTVHLFYPSNETHTVMNLSVTHVITVRFTGSDSNKCSSSFSWRQLKVLRKYYFSLSLSTSSLLNQQEITEEMSIRRRIELYLLLLFLLYPSHSTDVLILMNSCKRMLFPQQTSFTSILM